MKYLNSWNISQVFKFFDQICILTLLIMHIMFLISFNQVFPNLQIRALFFPNFDDPCTIFPKFDGSWPRFQIGRKIPAGSEVNSPDPNQMLTVFKSDFDLISSDGHVLEGAIFTSLQSRTGLSDFDIIIKDSISVEISFFFSEKLLQIFVFFREVSDSKEPIRTVLKNIVPDVADLWRKSIRVSEESPGKET